MAKSDEVKEIDGIVEFINKTYSANCKKILITGSGDPFASKSFRKFLFNFEPSQWPELKSVQLITNGKLFNEKNWNLMKAIQPYVDIVDVSIDAGTKDTYENKTRLGGHWETLLKNLKFLNSYSFIFSPRPGTTASNYDQIDKKILKERLKVLQEILFNNQKIKNKSFENNQVNVLVENKMKNQDKFFGRNEYMTSVIFKGNESLVGKIIPVKINNSNQNSLFGEILTNDVEAA